MRGQLGSETRRGFLGRSGLVAAGAAVVGVPTIGAASGGESRSLSSARRRTYAALVEAVGASPGTLVDSSKAGAAVGRLSRHYAASSAATRLRIDAILDALEEGGSFSRKSKGARVEHLRKQVAAEGGGGSATDAVALAAAAFHPSGFRWNGGAAATWTRVVGAAA